MLNRNKLLNAQQVATLANVSTPTLNTWYKWKQLNPEHELAKMLPDYIQVGDRQTRYWSSESVWMVLAFKDKIPRGRNGILGSVTQKYIKKEKKNGNTRKSN